MKLSFDHQTDYSLREFNKFVKKANFIPDYVKEASVVTTEDTKGFPKEAFADPYNRAYPKNTPSNTFLSYTHFLNKQAALKSKYNNGYTAKVEKNLKEAADIFGISADLEEYRTQFNVKEASSYEQRFVLETTIGGSTVEMFPFKTAEDLSNNAIQFSHNVKNLPFEWRKTASVNFVKFAKELGVEELPDIVCKYAGLFYPDSNKVAAELERRGFRHPSTDAKQVYTKLASLVHNYDSMEDYEKTAEICFELEKVAGIYDNKNSAAIFGDPVDMFFTIPVEKVAQELDVVKVNGDFYKVADLLAIDGEVYQQAFGIDKLASADELRDVLPTMPRSDFALFKQLSGISKI